MHRCRFNRNNGYAIRVMPMVVLVLAVACTLGLLATHQIAGPSNRPPHAIQRVVHVFYADRADDDRGLRDYRRLGEALERHKGDDAPACSLEFVQVTVGGPQSIAEAMRHIVSTRPAAIVASSQDVLVAAEAATQSIPIVFVSHEDPVHAGHVRSIAAPGVRRTGFTYYVPILPKAIEILLDAYPASRRIGVVVDHDLVARASFARELDEARAAFPVAIEVFVAADRKELGQALQTAQASAVDAWFVPMGDVLWNDPDASIRMLSSRSRPVLYGNTTLVRDGGLMSYQARFTDPFRILATQLLLILNGVDAAEIPIERPNEFEIALNLSAIGDDPRLRPSKNVLKRANVIYPGPGNAKSRRDEAGS